MLWAAWQPADCDDRRVTTTVEVVHTLGIYVLEHVLVIDDRGSMRFSFVKWALASGDD